MEERKTNLKQAEARINVTGIVSEKDLKMETVDGKTKITGTVTVKTNDTNFIRFRVNAAEKTKVGGDNPAFTGLKTVMDEYKTIAEVGEDEADKVHVNGEIRPYRGRNGEEIISYQASFFSRAMGEYIPKAEFSLEMYIERIVPEFKKVDGEMEETERKIVKGWVPTYNGIEPVEIIVTEDDADSIEDVFQPGMTTKFYGDVINATIIKKRTIPVVIGKPREEIKKTYVNQLILTGAEAPYEEETAYDKNTVLAAIQERENRIEEQKNKVNTTTTSRPSAASYGRSAAGLF